jgi:hypothetical protein
VKSSSATPRPLPSRTPLTFPTPSGKTRPPDLSAMASTGLGGGSGDAQARRSQRILRR